MNLLKHRIKSDVFAAVLFAVMIYAIILCHKTGVFGASNPDMLNKDKVEYNLGKLGAGNSSLTPSAPRRGSGQAARQSSPQAVPVNENSSREDLGNGKHRLVIGGENRFFRNSEGDLKPVNTNIYHRIDSADKFGNSRGVYTNYFEVSIPDSSNEPVYVYHPQSEFEGAALGSIAFGSRFRGVAFFRKDTREYKFISQKTRPFQTEENRFYADSVFTLNGAAAQLEYIVTERYKKQNIYVPMDMIAGIPSLLPAGYTTENSYLVFVEEIFSSVGNTLFLDGRNLESVIRPDIQLDSLNIFVTTVDSTAIFDFVIDKAYLKNSPDKSYTMHKAYVQKDDSTFYLLSGLPLSVLERAYNYDSSDTIVFDPTIEFQLHSASGIDAPLRTDYPLNNYGGSTQLYVEALLQITGTF